MEDGVRPRNGVRRATRRAACAALGAATLFGAHAIGCRKPKPEPPSCGLGAEGANAEPRHHTRACWSARTAGWLNVCHVQTDPIDECDEGEICLNGACEPASVADDACGAHADCGSCVRAFPCGWCDGRCVSGVDDGPEEGVCSAWAYDASECTDDASPVSACAELDGQCRGDWEYPPSGLAEGECPHGHDPSPAECPAPYLESVSWCCVPSTRPAVTGHPTEAAAVGAGHACAVRADGTLWCWGSGEGAPLGLGVDGYAYAPDPEQVGTATDWVSVFAGPGTSFAVSAAGGLFAWGQNAYQQLGLGDTVDRLVPTPVPGAPSFVAVSGSEQETCGIDAGGGLHCWGFDTGTPTQVGTDNGWRQVSVGTGIRLHEPDLRYACAVRWSGELYCWGRNESGQLGLGDTEPRLAPTRVGRDRDWLTVAVGRGQSCGTRAGGLVLCWGRDPERLGLGVAGAGTLQTTPALVQIAADAWLTATPTRDGLYVGRADGVVKYLWVTSDRAEWRPGPYGDWVIFEVNRHNAPNGVQSAGLRAGGSLWWFDGAWSTADGTAW